MFTGAILGFLEWINLQLLSFIGDNDSLFLSLQDFSSALYDFAVKILDNVAMPVAGTILALFFVLELYRASVRTEGMGGGAGQLGVEIVVKVLVKVMICKMVMLSAKVVMGAIFQVTTFLSERIRDIVAAGTLTNMIDVLSMEDMVESLGMGAQIGLLIGSLIAFFLIMIAGVLAKVLIAVRFIQLYIYLAISPIPLATLPDHEMSQIGKNFLKSFAAISLQGTLIFLVMSFAPYLAQTLVAAIAPGDFWGALAGVIGVALIILMAMWHTGAWAKAICNAA